MISNQNGFSLIIAIVILIIFGILAAMLTSLVTTDSDIAMYQARSGEALHIANGGLQYLMKQSYPNYSKPPYSGRGTSKVNLGSGGFIVDPPTVITDNPLTAPATTVNVASTTGFPSPSGRILIESELIDYTGTTGTSFTGATRGVGRSLAVQHNVDSGVYHATALTASATNADLTIQANTAGFMIPGTIKIDQEFLYCTGTVGGFSGCTRGTQGSQAVAHNSSATAIQITATVTATVSTGVIGNAQRVLKAQAGVYLDGWGVGNTGTLIRWNGINWDTVTTPVAQNLNSLSIMDTNSDGAADDGWAVGDRIAATTTGWTFLRWNSPTPGTWNQITIPATPRNAVNLNSVFMVSSTDGWALGDRRGCINPGPTILKWDGANWACPLVGVLPGSADQNLNSISMVSASDGWAVGNVVGGQPTMLRWNMSCPTAPSSANTWNNCTADAPATGQQLNSIFMISSTDGWAVGNRNGTRPTAIRWNTPCGGGAGTSTWNDCTSVLYVPAINQHLNSIYIISSNDGWAVGNAGAGATQRPLILYWNGTTWATRNSSLNINVDLNSVYCNSTSDCWAVGDPSGGTSIILHWNGSNWSRYAAPSTTQLNRVFIVSPQNFLRLADWQEGY